MELVTAVPLLLPATLISSHPLLSSSVVLLAHRGITCVGGGGCNISSRNRHQSNYQTYLSSCSTGMYVALLTFCILMETLLMPLLCANGIVWMLSVCWQCCIDVQHIYFFPLFHIYVSVIAYDITGSIIASRWRGAKEPLPV